MGLRESARSPIAAPPEQVFNLVTDASRLPSWNRAITEVVEAPERLEPGSVWKVRLHALGQSWVSTSTVRALDPKGGHFSYRSQTDDGNPSFADWDWRVDPDDDGSMVTVIVVELNPLTFWRKHLLVRVRRPALNKEIRDSLSALEFCPLFLNQVPLRRDGPHSRHWLEQAEEVPTIDVWSGTAKRRATSPGVQRIASDRLTLSYHEGGFAALAPSRCSRGADEPKSTIDPLQAFRGQATGNILAKRTLRWHRSWNESLDVHVQPASANRQLGSRRSVRPELRHAGGPVKRQIGPGPAVCPNSAVVGTGIRTRQWPHFD